MCRLADARGRLAEHHKCRYEYIQRARILDEENPPQNHGTRVISALSSTQATLAVCGDPIICRALVLLLRSPGYDVEYLPIASLSEPGSLADVRVLLLALERDARRRKATLELVSEVTVGTEVQVLELSTAFEKRSGPRGEHAWSDGKVRWPCSTEELKRYIADALSNDLKA